MGSGSFYTQATKNRSKTPTEQAESSSQASLVGAWFYTSYRPQRSLTPRQAEAQVPEMF